MGILGRSLSGGKFDKNIYEDLNIDGIISGITKDKKIKEIFYSPLSDISDIKFRQDVLKDLGSNEVLSSIKSFLAKLSEINDGVRLSGNLPNIYQRQSYYLKQATDYAQLLITFKTELAGFSINSKGLKEFIDYLVKYVGTTEFIKNYDYAKETSADLAEVKYSMHIKTNAISVKRLADEGNYAKKVQETFAKFVDSENETDYFYQFPNLTKMNDVESGVLSRIVKLFPQQFSNLTKWYENAENFFDDEVSAFAREIEFYLSYLEYIDGIDQEDLYFCIPTFADSGVGVNGSFDLALAKKLSLISDEDNPLSIVTNDWELKGEERLIVVTGPNQGGKTTFARSFGQIHYFALLGLSVPARTATVIAADRIFTCFEKQESKDNNLGRLEYDISDVRSVMGKATDKSLIIFNETFSSTSKKNGLILGEQLIEKLIDKKPVSLFVTFLDGLAKAKNGKVVSMVSEISADKATRSFKILRRPADGLAYVESLAQKYSLTFTEVRDRIC